MYNINLYTLLLIVYVKKLLVFEIAVLFYKHLNVRWLTFIMTKKS